MVRNSRTLLTLAAAACWMPATPAQDMPHAAGGPMPGGMGMPYGSPGMGMPGGDPGMGSAPTGYGGPQGTDWGAALGNYYQGGPAPVHGRFPTSDPFGPQRMAMPSLGLEREHAGGTMRNEILRPDSETLGIRLDSSYTLIREIELGGYFSERQEIAVLGGTLLPFQAPGWLVGFRGAATINGNGSDTVNLVGASTDTFLSTRYKHSYYKLGFLMDYTSKNQMFGGTFAALTRLPLIGNMTFDGAFSSGSGSDDNRLPLDPLTGRRTRVEVARSNFQMRVGKYVTNWYQTGLSASVTNFTNVNDQSQYGVWANWFHGGKTIGWDVAGGRGGLRGYVTLGLNWGGGKNIDLHPIDTGYDNPIDTVSWATRAPRRDPTIQLRSSNTGDPLPAVVTVTR